MLEERNWNEVRINSSDLRAELQRLANNPQLCNVCFAVLPDDVKNTSFSGKCAEPVVLKIDEQIVHQVLPQAISHSQLDAFEDRLWNNSPPIDRKHIQDEVIRRHCERLNDHLGVTRFQKVFGVKQLMRRSKVLRNLFWDRMRKFDVVSLLEMGVRFTPMLQMTQFLTSGEVAVTNVESALELYRLVIRLEIDQSAKVEQLLAQVVWDFLNRQNTDPSSKISNDSNMDLSSTLHWLLRHDMLGTRLGRQLLKHQQLFMMCSTVSQLEPSLVHRFVKEARHQLASDLPMLRFIVAWACQFYNLPHTLLETCDTNNLLSHDMKRLLGRPIAGDYSKLRVHIQSLLDLISLEKFSALELFFELLPTRLFDLQAIADVLKIPTMALRSNQLGRTRRLLAHLPVPLQPRCTPGRVNESALRTLGQLQQDAKNFAVIHSQLLSREVSNHSIAQLMAKLPNIRGADYILVAYWMNLNYCMQWWWDVHAQESWKTHGIEKLTDLQSKTGRELRSIRCLELNTLKDLLQQIHVFKSTLVRTTQPTQLEP